MVKTRLRVGYIIFTAVLLLLTAAGITFALLVLLLGDIHPSLILPVFLLILLILLYLLFNDCKYMVIDKQHGYLRWSSLFRPQGKWIELDRLAGFVRTVEQNQFFDRPAIYLIGKDRKIYLKISGFFCKNVDELAETLDLPKDPNYTEDSFRRKIYLK